MTATLHVLVVDNDNDCRDSMRLALSVLGCHVTTACQGIEAAELFSANEDVGIVFSDLNMGGPGLDGNDLFYKIHDEIDQRSARFVLISGSEQTDILYELKQHGALVIPKPIRFEQLEQLVRAQG